MKRRQFLKRLTGAIAAAIVPLNFDDDVGNWADLGPGARVTDVGINYQGAYGITIDANSKSISELYDVVNYTVKRLDRRTWEVHGPDLDKLTI